jgi:signal transduction histidine kinase
MRERVELYGGTLVTGSSASGGFQVSARLPLQPPGIPHDERADRRCV